VTLNLAALTYESKTTVVDFGDAGTLNIVWAAGKLTPALQSELTGASTDAMAIARVLSTLIVSWDMEIDGTPAPVTVEFIGSLPLEALGKVFKAMGEAVAVGEVSGAT
jgi:hypothetical protein